MTTEYRHIPVLLAEVTQQLTLHEGSIFVDCTLGGAGHAKRIPQLLGSTGILVGIDQDESALLAAADALRLGQQMSPEHEPRKSAETRIPGCRMPATEGRPEIVLVKGNFGNLDDALLEARVPYVDAFLFDLGVSSPQLDVADRGFTYQEDAPLDMRMDPQTQGTTAADIVNAYSGDEIARILREYGEERWASRIASFIVEARGARRIRTTGELVEIIKAAIPASARRGKGHPARRTFQALRIEVNEELEMLERGLRAAVRWLAPSGRIAVISYHSLEDGIVRDIFAEYAQGCVCPPDLPVCRCGKEPVLRIVSKRPIVPAHEEVDRNPRARSARMRVAERV